jgi:hypothetical protein
MSKTALLAAAAALALTAGGASAAQPSIGMHGAKKDAAIHIVKGGKLLYNQNSNSNGDGVDSQNFTSGTYASYDSSAADDFVVPKKTTWTVTGVDATGAYFNGSGPATSENVIFYADAKGVPGKAVKKGTFKNLKGTDSGGSFSIKLGKKGMKLKAGTYWVAVVANCSFTGGCGEWGWSVNTVIHGNTAVWQAPGGGFGDICPSWGTFDECISTSGGSFIPNSDVMFDLQGKAKKGK